ncbi:unnamed protein product, partial [Prorocentrum cordatum]
MLCGPMIMPGRAGPSPSLAELYGEEAARPLGASAARASEHTQVAAAQEAAATVIQAAFRGHAARAPCAARGAEAGCAERREAAATAIQAAFRGHAVRESRPAREPPAAPEVAAAAPQPEPLTVGARLDQSAALSTPPRLAFGLGAPPAMRASGVGASMLCGPMIMPGRAGPSPSLAELYGEEAARPLGASAARASEDTQVAAAQEAAATVIQAAFRGHAVRAPCPAREPPAAPEVAAAAPQPEPLTVGARLDQSAALSTPPRLAFGLGAPPAMRASGVGASMLCGPMIMPGRAGPSPSLAELYGEEAARPLGASAARALEDTQVAAAQEAAATQIQAAFRGHAARAPCAARGAEAGCAERREAAEAAATVIQAAFRGHAVRESRPAREPPAAPEVAAAAPQPEPLTVGARLDQSAAVSTPPRLAFGLGTPPALRASGVGAPVLCGPMIMPGRAGPSPSLAELYGEEAARPLGASAARALEDTQVAAAQEAAATVIQAAFRGHAARAPFAPRARAPCGARGGRGGSAARAAHSRSPAGPECSRVHAAEACVRPRHASGTAGVWGWSLHAVWAHDHAWPCRAVPQPCRAVWRGGGSPAGRECRASVGGHAGRSSPGGRGDSDPGGLPRACRAGTVRRARGGGRLRGAARGRGGRGDRDPGGVPRACRAGVAPRARAPCGARGGRGGSAARAAHSRSPAGPECSRVHAAEACVRPRRASGTAGVWGRSPCALWAHDHAWPCRAVPKPCRAVWRGGGSPAGRECRASVGGHAGRSSPGGRGDSDPGGLPRACRAGTVRRARGGGRLRGAARGRGGRGDRDPGGVPRACRAGVAPRARAPCGARGGRGGSAARAAHSRSPAGPECSRVHAAEACVRPRHASGTAGVWGRSPCALWAHDHAWPCRAVPQPRRAVWRGGGSPAGRECRAGVGGHAGRSSPGGRGDRDPGGLPRARRAGTVRRARGGGRLRGAARGRGGRGDRDPGGVPRACRAGGGARGRLRARFLQPC